MELSLVANVITLSNTMLSESTMELSLESDVLFSHRGGANICQCGELHDSESEL